MPENYFSKSDIKSKYLEKNPEYKLLENINPSKINIGDIVNDDNYEMWLVQCPANINLEEQLIDKSLKLPGKSRANNIETIAEEFSTPKTITLGYKSDQDDYSVGTFSALGRILIREKLRIIRNEAAEEEQSSNTAVSYAPFPQQLKQRHPLLGADFKDKLILNETIANRLKNCEEEIRQEQIQIKQEIKTEIDYEEDDVVIERKAKKKRRRVEKNPDYPEQSKKIKKDIESEDDESSLAWIKNL